MTSNSWWEQRGVDFSTPSRLVVEVVHPAQSAEGEVGDADGHIACSRLEDTDKDFAFDGHIIKCGVRFDEVRIFLEEAIGGFSGGLEVFSAFGLPPLVNAHPLVLVTVEQMFTSQTPNIEQGIRLATEHEHIGVKVLATLTATVGDAVTATVLVLFPLVVVVGVKLVDVKLGKGDSLFEVEHGVVGSHCGAVFHISHKLSHRGSPIGQDDFALVQHLDVLGTLARIISGVEHRGDGENFADKEILSRIDTPLAVDTLLAQVIDKGLGNSHLLSFLALEFLCIGQSCGFAIQYHIILSAAVELGFHKKCSNQK